MSDEQGDQRDAPHGPEQETTVASDAPPGASAPESSAPSGPADEHRDATAGQDPSPDAPAVVTDPPVLDSTGDDVVDAVLEQFDRVTGEPLATHIEAAEKVQDTLQSRLSDLGDG